MAKKPAPKRKLDLFMVLEALDQRDLNIYDEIAADAEAVKELNRDVGYMLPIWMTGAARNQDHAELVQRFNICCNLNWFDLTGKHRLQTRLLAHIGLGRKVAHRFNKVIGGFRNNAVLDLLILTHPDIRPEEARIWVQRHSLRETEELARGHGWTDEQVERLKKSYNEMRV